MTSPNNGCERLMQKRMFFFLFTVVFTVVAAGNFDSENCCCSVLKFIFAHIILYVNMK